MPSTAKVAQKAAAKANPAAFILDYALGANICGVIDDGNPDRYLYYVT